MERYRQTTGTVPHRSDQGVRCRAAAVVRAAVAGEGVDASTRMNALVSLGSSISVAKEVCRRGGPGLACSVGG